MTKEHNLCVGDLVLYENSANEKFIGLICRVNSYGARYARFWLTRGPRREHRWTGPTSSLKFQLHYVGSLHEIGVDIDDLQLW